MKPTVIQKSRMSILSHVATTLPVLLLLLISLCNTAAFVSQSSSFISQQQQQQQELSLQRPFSPQGKPAAFMPNTYSRSTKSSSPTQLYSFMGSDGGILGIGTPELFTILLVGYFILGPSDLYKLVKEIGKFVQNFQTFTSEATASLENNFESQLQLDEIRKAQRELNDAFSFRRSINVDESTDAFEVNAQSPRVPDAASEMLSTPAAAAAAISTAEAGNTAEGTEKAPTKKKIRRRRVKKKQPVIEEPQMSVEDNGDFSTAFAAEKDESAKNMSPAEEIVNDIPDLSFEDTMFLESDDAADKALQAANEELRKEAMENESDDEAATTVSTAADERRKERMERLQNAAVPSDDSADDLAILSQEEKDAAAARFQAQVSGNWNGQILDKSEELSPLAHIMDRLALLEEEKQTADERLQEEFRLREENEERFYREKRQLLEEAAAQVQAEAYNLVPQSSSDKEQLTK